jgi:hypothetical protein
LQINYRHPQKGTPLLSKGAVSFREKPACFLKLLGELFQETAGLFGLGQGSDREEIRYQVQGYSDRVVLQVGCQRHVDAGSESQ